MKKYLKNYIFTALINIIVIILIYLSIDGFFRINEFFYVPYPTQKEYRLLRPEPYINSLYFSKDFIEKSFEEPGGYLKINTNPPIIIPNNYTSTHLNVKDHKRVTTEQPQIYDFKILLFGGSTVHNPEVPDNLTIASQLQAILNQNNLKILVENYGVSSIHAGEQFQRLIYDAKIKKNDIVIFYDGYNDVIQRIYLGKISGAISDESFNAPYYIRFVRRYKSHSALLRWIDSEIFTKKDFNENLKFSFIAAKQYRTILEDVHKYVSSNDAKFLHFLQPNLFTKFPLNKYEEDLLKKVGSEMVPFGVKEVVEDAYPKFKNELKKLNFSTDLSDAFNTLEISPYLDVCHVTEAGNKIIATKIYEQIQRYLIK